MKSCEKWQQIFSIFPGVEATGLQRAQPSRRSPLQLDCIGISFLHTDEFGLSGSAKENDYLCLSAKICVLLNLLGYRTVRIVLPTVAPEVAVMVAVPPATAVARPLLLTVATSVFDELQVTCAVISWLFPSQ